MAYDINSSSFLTLPSERNLLEAMSEVGGASPEVRSRLSFLTGGLLGSTTPKIDGKTADEFFKEFQANFRRVSEDSIVARKGMDGEINVLKNNLANKAAGRAVNAEAVERAYEALVPKLKDQGKWLNGFEEALELSAHQPVEAALATQDALITQLDSLRNGGVSANTRGTAIKNAAGGDYNIAGIDAAHADLFEVRNVNGTKAELHMKVADVSSKSGAVKSFKIGTVDTSGSPVFTAVENEVRQAENQIAAVTKHITEGPEKFIASMKADMAEVKTKVTSMQEQVDEAGAKLFKKAKPPVFGKAVEKTAPALANAANEGENALKGLMTQSKDATKAALSVDGHKIMTNDLGVVGKEEAGLWSRLKANVLVEKNIINKETGAVEAVARGNPGKIFRGGTIAAGLGAIALGVKGLVSGKTDENGQSVPSDSGDMLKNGGLIVGGAAAVALLGLNKGKAIGALAH